MFGADYENPYFIRGLGRPSRMIKFSFYKLPESWDPPSAKHFFFCRASSPPPFGCKGGPLSSYAEKLML